MAAKKKQEIVIKAPAALGALEPWEQELAAEAKEVAAKETTFAPRISFKGGHLKVGGVEVKNNELSVIVVDGAYSKAFYEAAYDEDAPATPVCYAFGREEKDLKPHEQSPSPQAESCAVCPHNKFGSADRGKGKACKDERRLMCIPGDTAADAVSKAEAVMAVIPPTSLKNWGNYVKTLAAVGRTPWSVVTKLTVEPLKSYFQILFEPQEKLDGPTYFAVKSHRAVVEGMMMAPYPTLEAGEKDEKPAKRSRKF
jgi:hypothetical protein